MRTILFVVGAAVMNILLTAAAAFADSSLPDPDDPNVLGKVVTPPGASETAFTGGDILLLAAVAAVVLTLGIGLFAIGRRRATTAV